MTTSQIPGLPTRTLLGFERHGAADLSEQTERQHGGWDAKERAVTPFREVRRLFDSPATTRFAVDSICAADEAGVLTHASEIAPLFVTRADKRALLDWRFVSQGEWVNERHHSCFIGLFGPLGAESAASCKSIGEYLGEYVLEDAA